MSVKVLTCIECPVGCRLEVEVEGDKVLAVRGNGCPRGKLYAESEVVCPMRVLTTTIRSVDGCMVPVKTDKPIKKSEMLTVMEKLRTIRCQTPVKVGDVLYENIADKANLVATANIKGKVH